MLQKCELWLGLALGFATFGGSDPSVAASAAFVDVAAQWGIVAPNVSGGVEKWTILESTGAGACLFDAEGDGDLDLYLVNGGTLEPGGLRPAADVFYLQGEDGHFEDGTRKAGLGKDGWGGGCAAADIEGDGDTDLLITQFGVNLLYRNDGGGVFREVAAAAGLTSHGYHLGATFFDEDGDGDLDLYIARYLVFDPANGEMVARRCNWKGGEVMCGPRGFVGEPDLFYRNRGDGTFEAGVLSDSLYGMAAVAGDLDADGDRELFVANDSQPNLLLVQQGSGFEDQALVAGVALAGDGRAQSGMGADLGDIDGDGDEDLIVTHFSDDYHTLYRNEGNLLFTDISAAAGLDPASRSSVGWGGGFFDFDNDGDLDLLVASGHVYPGVENFDRATTYLQPNLLFENDGRGVFREVGQEKGGDLARPGTGRGAAFGDLDRDGDLDVVVVNTDGPPKVLRNEIGNQKAYLRLRLRGHRSPRQGLGARIEVATTGSAGVEKRQFREVRQGGGYLSSHEAVVHFGLGEATAVSRVEIMWPSGQRQVLRDLPVRCEMTVDEEQGLVEQVCRQAPVLERVVLPLPRVLVEPETKSELPPIQGQQGHQGLQGLQDRRAVLAAARSATEKVLAGRYAEAIAAFESLLSSLPEPSSGTAAVFGKEEDYRALLAALHDNLGVAQLRDERFDAAIASTRRAIEYWPGRSKHHHNLGLALFHARRFGEAVAALQQAATLPDPATDVRYDLGRALVAAQRCGEAEIELEAELAVMPKPDLAGRDAEALYLLGTCRESQNPAAAAAAYRAALAIVPGHQKARYKLTVVLERLGENTAAAEQRRLFLARRAAEEKAQIFEQAGRAGAKDRKRRIVAYIEAGQAPKAVQEAQKAIAADPSDAAAQSLLGEALLALRPPATQDATAAFQRALRLDPHQQAARLGLIFTRADRPARHSFHEGRVWGRLLDVDDNATLSFSLR